MDMSLNKLPVHDGQESLAYCSLWGHKESDMTEQLNNDKVLTEEEPLALNLRLR